MYITIAWSLFWFIFRLEGRMFSTLITKRKTYIHSFVETIQMLKKILSIRYQSILKRWHSSFRKFVFISETVPDTEWNFTNYPKDQYDKCRDRSDVNAAGKAIITLLRVKTNIGIMDYNLSTTFISRENSIPKTKHIFSIITQCSSFSGLIEIYLDENIFPLLSSKCYIRSLYYSIKLTVFVKFIYKNRQEVIMHIKIPRNSLFFYVKNGNRQQILVCWSLLYNYIVVFEIIILIFFYLVSLSNRCMVFSKIMTLRYM